MAKNIPHFQVFNLNAIARRQPQAQSIGRDFMSAEQQEETLSNLKFNAAMTRGELFTKYEI